MERYVSLLLQKIEKDTNGYAIGYKISKDKKKFGMKMLPSMFPDPVLVVHIKM